MVVRYGVHSSLMWLEKIRWESLCYPYALREEGGPLDMVSRPILQVEEGHGTKARTLDTIIDPPLMEEGADGRGQRRKIIAWNGCRVRWHLLIGILSSFLKQLWH